MLQIISHKLRYFMVEVLFCRLLLVMGCASRANTQDNQNNASSANPSDYSELDQYGDWINVSPYGEVWQPSVVDISGWQPFYHGHWAWTNYGWAWVSYEPYGWLVYHYGNWDFQPEVGWFWIPGDVWSPAQVQWIEYGDYIGWAPFPPAGVIWPDPWVVGSFMAWDVVAFDVFTSDNIGRYRLSHPPRRDEATPFVRRAPDVHELEQRTGKAAPLININREPVKSGNRQFERMRLPEPEEQRIEKHREQVQQEVLRPRTEETPARGYQERAPQPKKEKR